MVWRACYVIATTEMMIAIVSLWMTISARIWLTAAMTLTTVTAMMGIAGGGGGALLTSDR